MRVVALTTFHETCGIATYAEALVQALRDCGAYVRVLSPALRDGVSRRGKQPPRLWNLHKASVLDAYRTFRAIRKERPDAVHLQVNHGLYSARFVAALGLLCRAARLPMYATLHGRQGGDRRRRRGIRRLHAALSLAELIVHNEDHALDLRRKVHVIPHGIAPPKRAELAEAKRAIGLPAERPVIAHFGFIHPDKGIEAVFETIASMRSHSLPPFYLVSGAAFATSESQDYLKRLRRRIVQLDLSDHVRLDGEFKPNDRVLQELQAADWILLNYCTGANQGTSGAARHALCAGRPIAVSTAPVFDDLRGAVWTMDAPLERSLNRMMQDDALCSHIGERATEYCRQRSWNQVAEHHLKLFTSRI